jgi:hypothetical protein
MKFEIEVSSIYEYLVSKYVESKIIEDNNVFNEILIKSIDIVLEDKLPKGTGCDNRLDDYRIIKDKGSVNILSKLGLNGAEYEHRIYEQGGGGDCLFCCYAAAINESYRKTGYPKRVSFQILRDIIAEQIEEMTSVSDYAMLKNVYWGEQSDGIDDIIYIKKYLIEKTRKARGRWASVFDIKILQNIFGIGIIVLSLANGNVWCYGQEQKFNYYTLILHDLSFRVNNDDYGDQPKPPEPMPDFLPNHYTNIGIKKTGSSEDYEFLIKCDEIPETIIQNAIDNCKGVVKTTFGCPE